MTAIQVLTLVFELALELVELIRTGAKPAEVRRRLSDPTRAGAKVLAVLQGAGDKIDDYVKGPKP